ncbi:sensor histidine kinase [Anaerosporobacter sp.]|uniref:sensor histidine kinase n=1 Tax=Anaerosporobacter sp. TaxID=1872529 RepID=UPI00286F0AFA|nr:histidine kinase [Anaerosporobacter sp.]
MKKLWQRFEEYLDNYNIKMKLLILYVICVLLPLIVTDSVIIYTVIQSAQLSRQHNMENISGAVSYSFFNSIDNASRIGKSIYTNRYVDQFLETEYESPLDYVTSRQSFMKDTLFDSGFGLDSTLITMYSDNETIVSGGEFDKISSVSNSKWYQYLQESGRDQILCFYYDDSKSPAVSAKRKIVFVRKLNFFNSHREKLIKLEIDYSKMVRNLVEMNYDVPIYICLDGKVMLSNTGSSSIVRDFETFTRKAEVGYVEDVSLYGLDLKIYVLNPKVMALTEISSNLPVILLLIVVNVVLPLILVREINHSFTTRLRELSCVFECVEDEKLVEIKTVRGKDEIGSLMRNYNRMAVRTNDLIQTVYLDKLREQEINIAKQKAELLALHSQINPHFMFNALESIRMHSILKKEFETAEMVERLAIMERQNVEWGNDSVEICREMEFVKAYLEIQKYRFGDRLSYMLDVEPEFYEYRIPKLTVVTFVENACVHGIESKTAPGWIFVRVFREQENMCLEIEDTGGGMEESFMEELYDKMVNASIERLQDKGRVGIINACLRLKMVTNEEVRFELEGEKGMGTTVRIWIPLDYCG